MLWHHRHFDCRRRTQACGGGTVHLVQSLERLRDSWLESQQALLADVTMTIDDRRDRHRTWAHLPLEAPADLGRRPGSLLPVLEPWMPQLLTTFEGVGKHGWVVTAGTAVTVEVTGARVLARVLPGGSQLLGRGAWKLLFPTLDHLCRLDVRVYPPDKRQPVDPRTLTRPREVDLDHLLVFQASKRTAADMIGITPTTKHRLAVLYRHLMQDSRAPENLCATAAAELHMEEDAVRRLAYRVRDRLNEHRSNPLGTLDDLGDFLVHTGQVLNPDHLNPPEPGP